MLGRDINAKPTAQQVNQLVYIGQILKESLRLWPTAPAFGLYPYQNETIGGKYKLRKRTFVTVLTAMLHRDQSVWGPRAEVFDPENFAPEREAKMPPHAYKPFGNGQRACIGRQFAMTEATLVLGLILQRFRLVDHTRYQLKIKESLTIKPEGLMMRVKLRPDVVRGSGVSVAARPAPKKAAPKKAAKSHGTKLTVLFGSNMGTAEELARSIADSGEAQGFETTLAGLDDHAGKLPTEGAVAIVCASYNGGPPDNAGAFIKSLRDAAPGSLSGVRYTVFGCGNRDWASTYQAIPRQIDELLAAKGAERIYVRGEGDAKEDLDGHFQAWNDPLLPALADKLGVTLEADAGAAQEPLYQVQAVDKPPVNPIIGGTGALPMRVLANRELQKPDASGRSTRHIEVLLPDGVSYRAGDHLSIVPQNAAALVERALRRFAFAPGAHVMLAAAEGRRANLPVGEAIAVHRLLSDFVELQHPATRKQIQTMAQHTRCPFTRPKLEALLDEERFRAEILAKRKSVLDLLGRASGVRAAVRGVPGNAAADDAALLLDLVLADGRRQSLRDHRGGGRGAGALGQRRLSRRLLQPSAAPGRRRHGAGLREGDQGGLPPAGRSGGADRHDRAGHGPGALPRLLARARRAQGAGPQAWVRRCCSSAAAIPSTTSSMPTSSRNRPMPASLTCMSPSRATTARRPTCRTS